MRWIEIIRLRSTGSREASFIEDLGRRVAEIVGTGEEVLILRHGSVATDLAVHIAHETSSGERPDESLGEQLMAMLDEQGLTSRSLWIQMSTEDEGRLS